MNRDYIWNFNDEFISYLKSTRANLNAIPELGMKEYKTSAYIKNELDKMGYAYKSHIETSVSGMIKGSDPSKTIAFRADMDALNSNNQIKHLCGHDGHMTILLGLLNYIKTNKIIPKNNIVFIFQPAEEAPGGAQPMIENNLMTDYNINEIFGLHIYPELKKGEIGCKKGPFLARICEIDVEILGKAAHGAAPHKGKDAILIASQFLNMVQGIISREISPINPAVLTFGSIHGGSRRNIICDKVNLEATLRVFSDEVYDFIKSRVISIAKGLELAHNCTITVNTNDDYPAVNNDEALYEQFKSLITSDESLKYIDLDYLMISEDFSYYQKEVQGLFFMLGSQNEELGHIHGLHTHEFDFEPEVLLDGIDIFLKILKSKNVI